MTTPVSDARVYSDFAGLDSLKRGAKANDPAAVRQVAKQLESVFARMMIKSMRDAVGTDPIFGSDESKMYQGMFDDQLSVDMTRGKGLGLADMLVRQLQHQGTAQHQGAVTSAGSATGHAASTTGSAPAPAAPAQAPAHNTHHTAATTHATPEERAQFVRQMWPQAQNAGAQLGVDPRNLIAQAALETNWGKSLPAGSAGSSSNNLFGIKAGRSWSGAATTANTVEYQAGKPKLVNASFRSYDSPHQSMQNYVDLIKGNARYAGALNTGNNTTAFANALQRGGYATDPNYARKISAVARTVSAAIAASPPEISTQSAWAQNLKFQTDLPIYDSSGRL